MIFKAGADVVRTITSISHYQSVKMIFREIMYIIVPKKHLGKNSQTEPTENISIPSPKYNLHLQQEF